MIWKNKLRFQNFPKSVINVNSSMRCLSYRAWKTNENASSWDSRAISYWISIDKACSHDYAISYWGGPWMGWSEFTRQPNMRVELTWNIQSPKTNYKLFLSHKAIQAMLNTQYCDESYLLVQNCCSAMSWCVFPQVICHVSHDVQLQSLAAVCLTILWVSLHGPLHVPYHISHCVLLYDDVVHANIGSCKPRQLRQNTC